MSKKILSMVLLVAMIISSMSMAVAAAYAGEEVTIDVSTTAEEVSKSEQFTLTVTLEQAVAKLGTLYITMDYNEAQLAVVGKPAAIMTGGSVNDFTDAGNKYVMFTWDTDSTGTDYPAETEVFNVTFEVLVDGGIANVAPAITIKSGDFADATLEQNDIPYSINQATVKVLAGACEHIWGEGVVTKDATCTEDGVKTYTCTVCGGSKTEAIPALGHTWDEGVVTKEPTCTEAGVMTYTCTVCGETESEDIPALGHTWGDDDICDICGAEKEAEVIRPVGPSKDDEEEGIVLPFTDVLPSDWFYNDVVYVYENGLMNGMTATTFGPYGNTTRGQIVTILWRLEGQPAVNGACPFTDVAVGSYYEDAITWAAANGIVTGYDATTFGPDDQITREQMAAILYRYAQGKQLASPALTDNLADFADAGNVSAYAVEAMNWAVGQGLINGMGDGTVAPQGQAIRAQAAAILHRFCDTLELL